MASAQGAEQGRHLHPGKAGAARAGHMSRRSSRSKFTNMSAQPADYQDSLPTAAIGLFGTDIAIPYDT